VTLRSAGSDLVSPAPDQQRWGHGYAQRAAGAGDGLCARAWAHHQQRSAGDDADVSPETVRRDLADLVEKNLLLRIGSKRATYYILK
jgi:hypothetical protein